MEMPKPTENHARLAAFAGRWTGEEKIHPSPWDPQGGTATARIDSRMTCDGFCLVTDYVEERNGAVTYVGHGVTGYDTKRGCYLQHWSDSMGGMPADAKPGAWIGDTLGFQVAGPHGHSRYLYRLTAPDVYEFRIENSPDGVNWQPFIEARYVRAPEPAKAKKPAKPKKKAAKPKPKPKAKAKKKDKKPKKRK
jgi:hypothetical protein